jgi:hypothetical protein
LIAAIFRLSYFRLQGRLADTHHTTADLQSSRLDFASLEIFSQGALSPVLRCHFVLISHAILSLKACTGPAEGSLQQIPAILVLALAVTMWQNPLDSARLEPVAAPGKDRARRSP